MYRWTTSLRSHRILEWILNQRLLTIHQTIVVLTVVPIQKLKMLCLELQSTFNQIKIKNHEDKIL